MPGLSALIFDFDGTLADTERDGHRVAFNRAFRDAGLDWEWDEALYGSLLQVAGGKERIAHYAAVHCPDWQAAAELESRLAALHAAKTRHFAEIAARGAVPLRPGALRLLGEARAAGLALAIATTAAPEAVRAVLSPSLGDLADWFDVIGAGDVVPRKKPAPDIYLWVLDRLGCAAQQCLAIEDSGPGLAAARAAGIPTLVTVSDYTRGQDFSGALAVLSDLGEPGRPAEVLQGSFALRSGWVDLDALKGLHGSRGL